MPFEIIAAYYRYGEITYLWRPLPNINCDCHPQWPHHGFHELLGHCIRIRRAFARPHCWAAFNAAAMFDSGGNPKTKYMERVRNGSEGGVIRYSELTLEAQDLFGDLLFCVRNGFGIDFQDTMTLLLRDLGFRHYKALELVSDVAALEDYKET